MRFPCCLYLCKYWTLNLTPDLRHFCHFCWLWSLHPSSLRRNDWDTSLVHSFIVLLHVHGESCHLNGYCSTSARHHLQSAMFSWLVSLLLHFLLQCLFHTTAWEILPKTKSVCIPPFKILWCPPYFLRVKFQVCTVTFKVWAHKNSWVSFPSFPIQPIFLLQSLCIPRAEEVYFPLVFTLPFTWNRFSSCSSLWFMSSIQVFCQTSFHLNSLCICVPTLLSFILELTTIW